MDGGTGSQLSVRRGATVRQFVWPRRSRVGFDGKVLPPLGSGSSVRPAHGTGGEIGRCESARCGDQRSLPGPS